MVRSKMLRWTSRICGDPGVVSALRLSLVLAAVFLPAVALAYPGEQFIMWARGTIVAPLCLFAIVGAIIAILFRPQHAVVLIGVVVGSLLLMWVMSNGSQITSELQQTQ